MRCVRARLGGEQKQSCRSCQIADEWLQVFLHPRLIQCDGRHWTKLHGSTCCDLPLRETSVNDGSSTPSMGESKFAGTPQTLILSNVEQFVFFGNVECRFIVSREDIAESPSRCDRVTSQQRSGQLTLRVRARSLTSRPNKAQ